MALGYPHPKYLKPLLDARDLMEWEAYERIEPFGGRHNEQLMGHTVTWVVNSLRSGAPIEPIDVMPNVEREPETVEEMHRNLMEWKGLS